MAVIPIFVNAGAAVLPTIAAAVASVLMVALKPRELVHLVRRRPMALGVLSVAIAVGLGIILCCFAFRTPVHAAKRGATVATVHYDWARVAEQLIAQERLRQGPQTRSIVFGNPSTRWSIVKQQ